MILSINIFLMSKNLQVLDLLLVFFLRLHPYHWQIELVVTNVLVLLEMYTSNLAPILIIKLIIKLIKFEIILKYFYLIIINYNSVRLIIIELESKYYLSE